MLVKYVGGMTFFDGLFDGKVYEVIGENDTQYIVDNELGAKSTIQKDKFEIVE